MDYVRHWDIFIPVSPYPFTPDLFVLKLEQTEDVG